MSYFMCSCFSTNALQGGVQGIIISKGFIEDLEALSYEFYRERVYKGADMGFIGSMAPYKGRDGFKRGL